MRFVTLRCRAFRTTVDFCVGVAKLNGDTSDLLVNVLYSIDTRDGFYHSAFTVSDVSDGSDVYGGLTGDSKAGLGVYFFSLLVALLCKVGLFSHEFFYFFFA